MNVRKTLLLVSFLAALGASANAGNAQDQTQGKTDASGAATDQGQTPPPPGNMGPRAGGQQPGAAAPGQQAPNVETVATHNGWIVQCGSVQGAEGQPPVKACGMSRTGQNDKEQKVGITLIVKRLKGPDGKFQTLMDAWAPIGVYLPTGVAMEIDGTALEGRMSFTRCLPQACNAFGEAGDATLKKFTKGKQVIFYVYDRPGNGYPVKFPLSGFADGIADLDKYAPEPPPQPAAAAPAAPAATDAPAAAPAAAPPKKK